MPAKKKAAAPKAAAAKAPAAKSPAAKGGAKAAASPKAAAGGAKESSKPAAKKKESEPDFTAIFAVLSTPIAERTPDQINVVQLHMKSFPMFDAMDSESRAAIVGRAKLCEEEEGDWLWEQGASPAVDRRDPETPHFYVMLTATVALMDAADSSNPTLSLCRPGFCVGVEFLVDPDCPARETPVVVEVGKMMSFTKADLASDDLQVLSSMLSRNCDALKRVFGFGQSSELSLSSPASRCCKITYDPDTGRQSLFLLFLLFSVCPLFALCLPSTFALLN
jgi:hypothetical protein